MKTIRQNATEFYALGFITVALTLSFILESLLN